MKKVLGRQHYRVIYVVARDHHNPKYQEILTVRDFTGRPPKH